LAAPRTHESKNAKVKKPTAHLQPLLFCLLIAGCSLVVKPATNPSLLELKPDIERDVKVGMNVQDAKNAMESLGFRCELMKDATLRYYADSSDITMTKIEDVDFLACRINQQDGFIAESLTVSLLLEGDSIEQVFYVRDLSGL
jgi:hypothetical protein